MANQIYTIDRTDWPFLERVWDFAQANHIDMYKTRVTATIVSWVIALPEGKLTTRYLLEFGEYSTSVMGTYYV